MGDPLYDDGPVITRGNAAAVARKTCRSRRGLPASVDPAWDREDDEQWVAVYLLSRLGAGTGLASFHARRDLLHGPRYREVHRAGLRRKLAERGGRPPMHRNSHPRAFDPLPLRSPRVDDGGRRRKLEAAIDARAMIRRLPAAHHAHRLVLCYRYLLGLTQVETGIRMNLTHQRIQQLERAALHHLRTLYTGRGDRPRRKDGER